MEGKREKEKEKHQSAALHTTPDRFNPDWGLNPQPEPVL